ncbi:thioredoxin family protein [Bradyrhizobium sp. 83012]|uniref:Thioredoxin family protein n=1 Tax=Bradyrhizobium aeschynomenes TaxID=2734909 RepID=A0ABX2CF15_9BRAD|nr:thioredoxin family protein [Bradyrhizobium aeschynomenes]NPU09617.1 thioredoxin family protein [Bradyrhizobium aeschynomenes]NPU65889.1 thioredoxin family protein [Bradyrhizobium aeschynomenes]NPV20941.1 thioredoxin family protein [Bradyrhizobium aeschynomenes]
MKNVKILGSGCKRCVQTAAMASSEASRLGIEIELEKITDFADIARFGIASTPGVVIDGKVVHAGGLPKAEDMAKWLSA